MPRLPRKDTIPRSQTGPIRLPTRGISSIKLVDDVNIFRISQNDVSNPPTAAQITTALGAPSGLHDGVAGIVDDAGGGTAVWLCIAKGSAWWYELLTKAV